MVVSTAAYLAESMVVRLGCLVAAQRVEQKASLLVGQRDLLLGMKSVASMAV